MEGVRWTAQGSNPVKVHCTAVAQLSSPSQGGVDRKASRSAAILWVQCRR